MAFTFVKARGGAIGNSLCEDDMLDMANDLVKKAAAANVKLLLPSDAVTAAAVDASATTSIVPVDSVPDGQLGLDIGPASIKEYERHRLRGHRRVERSDGSLRDETLAAGTLAVANGRSQRRPRVGLSRSWGGATRSRPCSR